MGKLSLALVLGLGLLFGTLVVVNSQTYGRNGACKYCVAGLLSVGPFFNRNEAFLGRAGVGNNVVSLLTFAHGNRSKLARGDVSEYCEKRKVAEYIENSKSEEPKSGTSAVVSARSLFTFFLLFFSASLPLDHRLANHTTALLFNLHICFSPSTLSQMRSSTPTRSTRK